MEPLEHPHYPGYIINPDSAIVDPDDGAVSFEVQGPGGSRERLPSMLGVDPSTLAKDILNDRSAAFSLFANALADLEGVSTPGAAPERRDDSWAKTIGPALQKGTTANIFGAPVDLMNLLTRAIVDTPINLGRWAARDFEGEMPSERYASAEVPFGGSESIARGLEAVGRGAKELRLAADETIGTINLPLTPDIGLGLDWEGFETGEFGPQDLLRFIEFDMTPDESTKARKYVSLITQIAAGAPIEGALIAKLVEKLAKTTKSPSKKAIFDAVSEMQRTNPTKAAGYEALMGTAVGTSMVVSTQGLEAAYPNAPPWMKNLVMAGGAIILPIGGLTVGKLAWDVGIKTPIVNWPLHFAKGAAYGLTTRGAERAAARAVQTKGSDWKHRSDILGVTEHFRLALKEGRNMDEATRISYTTPQLARNEANFLEAQLKATAKDMNEAELAGAQELIRDLRIFANFQEGQLLAISEGTGRMAGVSAREYVEHSGKMMDRRDAIFQALDDAVLKLDLGGKPSEGVELSIIQADFERGLATGSYEFNVNRQKAFQEGRLGSLEPEQTQAISDAYANVRAQIDKGITQSLEDARRRVELIRNWMPDDMSPETSANFNRWIRREIETAYKEIDTYEDMLWTSIRGFDQPKTAAYTSPDGVDLGPQILIDDVPIGEFFAAKVANLDAGERVNQSKWLWKLAGRAALVDQATKGAGPDAEKVARQRLRIEKQENIVAQREKEMDEAAARLDRDEKTPPESSKLREARANLAEAEGRLASGDYDAGTAANVQAAETATRRIRGLEDKIGELEAQAEAYPNPVVEKSREAFAKAQGDFVKAQGDLDEARGSLDITMGKGVEFEGNPVKLAEEVADSSELGVRMVDEVPVGRKAQEVQNIISLLKGEMTYEQGRPVRNTRKIAAIGGMIDDLQRAITDPENFDIDIPMWDTARSMTALKKDAFEKGAIGRLRGFTTKGEPKVELEATLDKLLPSGTASAAAQQVALRELQAALTPITTGRNTPFRIRVGEDGKPTPELDRNFNLEKYATEPPPPFEMIRHTEGEGRSMGFQVKEGTPPTESNIRLIRETLWDRFKNFGTGDKFDARAAGKWLEDNKSAINWLRKATKKDTGFEDLTNAERVVQYINRATADNLDATVNEMRSAGAFNKTFTEEGFKALVRDTAKRESNLISAAQFLDTPDPLTLGPTFLNSYLAPGTTKPTELLNNTLRVLENGALPDGTNPALEGFRQAVAEAILKRGLTDGSGATRAAEHAKRLTGHLDTTVKLWDPEELSKLAQDQRFTQLMGELYGKDAPELFRKIAEGAKLQSLISEAATPGVQRQDRVSDEWAGNLGRIIGGYTSKFIPVPALVMTGAGRRYGISTLAEVRGTAIDRLIVDLLMDPELMAAAIKKYPIVSPQSNMKFWDKVKLRAHHNFVEKNAERIRRLGQAPGVLYEIGEPTKYEKLDEAAPGPQAYARPTQPPRRRVASAPLNPPIGASILGQTNVLAPPPQGQAPSPQGRIDPQRMAQMSDLGMPLFRGNKGGIVSVPRKPKQLVG